MAPITEGVARVSLSHDNIDEEIQGELLRDSDSPVHFHAKFTDDDQESTDSRELKQTSESP